MTWQLLDKMGVVTNFITYMYILKTEVKRTCCIYIKLLNKIELLKGIFHGDLVLFR